MQLLDWKRRVFGLYAAVRAMAPESGWELWRETRDELFRTHPQSPLPPERRASFAGLEYWPYDPQARVLAELEDVEAPPQPIATSGTEPILFRPFARASFELRGEPLALEVAWLAGYGGGAFLCFRDATSGRESYGGGRYLLDTVKGADLGEEDGQARARLQLRLQPVLLVRPGLGLSARRRRRTGCAVAVEAGERHVA